MNFFKYYTGIIILCALAGFCAKYLVMSPHATALMYLDAKLYEDAVRRYEQQLNSGDKSGNVIIPLALLYKMRGEEKRSQGLLIKYINENPDLKDAHKALERMTRPEFNDTDYKRILESAANSQSMDDILRAISGCYETRRMDERQIELLTEIARRPERKESDVEYAKLVRYYSLNMKLATTLATATRQALLPAGKRMPGKNFIRAICAMVNAGQCQEALSYAIRNFEGQTPVNTSELEEAAYILLGAGQPTMAGELCERFLKDQANHETLRLFRSRVECASGSWEKAFTDLKSYYGDRLLKARQSIDMLTMLAMRKEDGELLYDILRRTDSKDIPYATVYDFAFYALRTRDRAIASLLRNKIDSNTLAADPCLAFIIKAAGQRLDLRAAVAQALAGNSLKEIDREQLAYILFHYKRPKDALPLIKEANPKTLLSLFKMGELAELLASAPARQYGPLGDANTNRIDGAVKHNALLDDTRLLMDITSGDKAPLQKLRTESPPASIEILTDLYCHAMRSKRYPAAADIAELMRKDGGGESCAVLQAKALIKAGQNIAAAKMLADMTGKFRAVPALFVRACANEAGLHGAKALPEELRTQAGEEVETIMASGRALPEERKSAALYLAATGSRKEAEILYLSVCKNTEQDADDVSALVKICAGKPSPEARQWLLKQAASGRWERWQGLEWLNQAGLEKDTVNIVENTLRTVEMPFLPDYLEALLKTGQARKADSVIRRHQVNDFLKAGIRVKMKMIGILPETGFGVWTGRILRTVTRDEMLDSLEAPDIATAFIAAGMADEGLRLFGETGRTGKELLVRLFLHAFNGDAGYVSPWIAKAGVEEDANLESVYYFSMKNGKEAVALLAAKRLFENNGTKGNRMRLAEAFLKQRMYDKAIPLTCDDAETDSQAGALYLAAVSALASEGTLTADSPEIPRMLHICEHIVSNPSTPEQLKVNAAYALSNTGHHSLAKRIFHDFAEKRPDTKNALFRMYLYSAMMEPERQDFKDIGNVIVKTRRDDEAALLALLGTYGMLDQSMTLIERRYAASIPPRLYPVYLDSLLKCRKMKVFAATAKKLPQPSSFTEQEKTEIFTSLMLGGEEALASRFFDETGAEARLQIQSSFIRRLGYYFANKGDYGKAMPIFFELAKQNPAPDSSDICSLVNFPGSAEFPPLAGWLVKQAKASTGERQLQWLELLNYTKHPQAVIDIIEEARLL